jgi:hypothetical protein
MEVMAAVPYMACAEQHYRMLKGVTQQAMPLVPQLINKRIADCNR